MTITLTVMAAAIVFVGLIVLGMAVRSIKLAAPLPRRLRHRDHHPDGVGR